ncbi:hypothetical protein [Nocardia blacklockiae]|uniref:hypothetical protein n=1 Tax=Nocardia blacklockiae TaxID=480036 RepID=UPI00189505B7|nr:hypothetical protein [Nocardia blacklockiae]MBF6175242.1 hypothetical protein [Nocardia blacklockiae]
MDTVTLVAAVVLVCGCVALIARAVADARGRTGDDTVSDDDCDLDPLDDIVEICRAGEDNRIFGRSLASIHSVQP